MIFIEVFAKLTEPYCRLDLRDVFDVGCTTEISNVGKLLAVLGGQAKFILCVHGPSGSQALGTYLPAPPMRAQVPLGKTPANPSPAAQPTVDHTTNVAQNFARRLALWYRRRLISSTYNTKPTDLFDDTTPTRWVTLWVFVPAPGYVMLSIRMRLIEQQC